MDITRGDVAAFSEGTVQEVLEVAHENIRADLSTQLTVEKEHRAAVEKEREAAVREEAERRARIASLCKAIGKYAAAVPLFAVVTLLGIGTFYSFPWTLPPFQTVWSRYLIGVAQGLVLLYAFVSMIWGTSIAAVHRKLATRVATWSEDAVLRILGYED